MVLYFDKCFFGEIKIDLSLFLINVRWIMLTKPQVQIIVLLISYLIEEKIYDSIV